MNCEWSCLMWTLLHGYDIPNHSLTTSLYVKWTSEVTPCPHILCVCVTTKHSVMPVSSVGVSISAPHCSPFLFVIGWLVGWEVGLCFCFGKYGVKWVLDIIAGRQLGHRPPSTSLWWFGDMKGWFNGREVCSSFYISLFLWVEVSSLHSFWQSKKWDWLCSFKIFFLSLVMTIHTEQRCGVSILDELIALGLEYCFQDLPEVVFPEGCVLSLFIATFVVWPYCNFLTARFCYYSSLQQ